MFMMLTCDSFLSGQVKYGSADFRYVALPTSAGEVGGSIEAVGHISHESCCRDSFITHNGIAAYYSRKRCPPVTSFMVLRIDL